MVRIENLENLEESFKVPSYHEANVALYKNYLANGFTVGNIQRIRVYNTSLPQATNMCNI
jgi:hypothetical protein